MDGTQDLWQYIVTWQNCLIVGAAWCLIQWLSNIYPKAMQSHWAKRLKPGAAGFWCSICMWIPELEPEGLGVVSRLLMGIILGAVSVNLHTLVKHTIFGKFFIEQKKERQNNRLRNIIESLKADPHAVRVFDVYFVDDDFRRLVDQYLDDKNYPVSQDIAYPEEVDTKLSKYVKKIVA